MAAGVPSREEIVHRALAQLGCVSDEELVAFVAREYGVSVEARFVPSSAPRCGPGKPWSGRGRRPGKRPARTRAETQGRGASGLLDSSQAMPRMGAGGKLSWKEGVPVGPHPPFAAAASSSRSRAHRSSERPLW